MLKSTAKHIKTVKVNRWILLEMSSHGTIGIYMNLLLLQLLICEYVYASLI